RDYPPGGRRYFLYRGIVSRSSFTCHNSNPPHRRTVHARRPILSRPALVRVLEALWQAVELLAGALITEPVNYASVCGAGKYAAAAQPRHQIAPFPDEREGETHRRARNRGRPEWRPLRSQGAGLEA